MIEEYKPEPEITHNSRNVVTVKFPYVHKGWEQYVLLTSDRHHDSKWTDRELEIRHLEMAKERNAFVVDVGDMFDVMQGKFDPRRSYRDLRPEYSVENYLDEIVKDAAGFFGPYAKQFLIIGTGNHESAVLKNNGVDLIGNLVHRLNSDYGGKVACGLYGGWVRFQFHIGGTQQITKKP